MKKTLFFIIMFFAFSSLIAQNEGTKKDTTRIKMGNRTIIIVEDKKVNEENKDVQVEEEVIIENEEIEAPEVPEAPEAPEPPEAPGELSDEEIEVEVMGDENGDADKEIRIKKVKKPKYHADKYSRWAGLNLGFNQLRDLDDYSSLEGSSDIWENKIWGSRTWNLNLFEYSLSLVKRHLLLTTGIGFEFRNYSFKKDFDLVYNGDVIEPVLSEFNYSKNKLHASYVQVPLLVEINTSSRPKKGLYLGAGIIGGYKMNSHLEQEYEFGDQEIEKETEDDNGFNLNDYQLMGTLRLGIDRITFIGNFDLLPVFEKDKSITGDGIGNISLGVQLVGF
ncbi:MAG: outer membrane beta-barrel protein [Deltaproteobacteria bacterium]